MITSDSFECRTDQVHDARRRQVFTDEPPATDGAPTIDPQNDGAPA